MSPGSPPSRHPPRRPGPADGKRQLNRRRRIDQLCQAGLDLFLERGVDSVTIDDIARRACVAKGSFYRYFKNKEDLVSEIIAPLGDAVDRAFTACERALSQARTRSELTGAYELFAVHLAQAVMSNRDAARLYLQDGRAPTTGDRGPLRGLADNVFARALDLTRAARTHGLLRAFDPRISALAVIGAGERLVYAHLVDELDPVDPARIPEQLISLVLEGLGTARPR